MQFVHGRFTNPQRRVVRKFVAGQEVYDLGAGLCALSLELAVMGAKRVIAIDAQEPPRRVLNILPDVVEFTRLPFEVLELQDNRPSLVLLSWPELNGERRTTSLNRILEEVPTIIYLGRNDKRYGCGNLPLWQHLSSRELLHHVPARTNTLLVFGPNRVKDRPLTLEERWAKFHLDPDCDFEEHPDLK